MDSSYIVHYMEYGKSREQAVFWFVMELLAGDPLDTLLRTDGPWQEVDAIRVRARAAIKDLAELGWACGRDRERAAVACGRDRERAAEACGRDR